MKQLHTITVSAPAKLMLLGEHAVVYNRPCLVTAVNQRMKIIATILNEPVFELDATDVNIHNYQKSMPELGHGEIPKGARFVEFALKNFSSLYPIDFGIHIETFSDFSKEVGFGSSSASVVSTIKALSKLLDIDLGQRQIFDIAEKTVLDVSGQASGFDIAQAVFGGTLYFLTGGRLIEPVETAGLELVVGYSGAKADTVTMVNLLKYKINTQKEAVEKIFDSIGKLVNQARQAIEDKDWSRLGTLMNYDQDYLEDLGVSTEKLNAMIEAARDAGAYGAKLSGAGGGDCMIALICPEKKKTIQEAIEKAGGQVINVKVNAPGVRIEQ